MVRHAHHPQGLVRPGVREGIRLRAHRSPAPARTLRYGEGNLAGKRALVVVSTGSPEPALGPRGVNGRLDRILFPLLHGTLWYTGMSVLPPVAVHGADRLTPHQFEVAAAVLRERVAGIEDTAPIPFRRQNAGDYDDALVLRP